MQPKIHLVGGRTASFVNEAVLKCATEPGNSNMFAALRGGRASALLEGYLATIITAVGASAGIVRLLSPDGQQLSLIGSSGTAVEFCRCDSVVESDCGVCGKAASSGEIEVSEAEFCASRYGREFFAEHCSFVLAVPVPHGGKAGAMAGVLTLFFASAQNVTDEVERTLKSYAELLRISLHSVWQNEDAQQMNLLKERQSIANEIHDSLAQTLYFAKMRASLLLGAMKSENDLLAFKCAQDVSEALDSSQKTVRELVTHFRCQMDPRGLEHALRKLVKEFSGRGNIALEYGNKAGKLALPAEYELQIFLIMREALVNIAAHSAASKAYMQVACSAGVYEFTVEDNGNGFGTGIAQQGHYGLEIMRERALRIGGSLTVDSHVGRGTRVCLIFSAPGL